MKWLSAGLTFVNLSTVFGLILGIIGDGLSVTVAVTSLALGGLIAAAAYIQTSDPEANSSAGGAPDPQPARQDARLSKRALRRLQKDSPEPPSTGVWRYKNISLWLVGACFFLFAARSFCWLIYVDGNDLRVQSPNNLGDLALHITYIRNFASGVPLWPDNPIYVYSKLRYPAGIDIFNALLCKANVDLIPGLIWVGLLASVATCYAFWRWGGAFGIAAFLFNGGLAGFEFLKNFKFADYQGGPAIAWKSIPLTMFVTQRGLLYAIPAGLLLLWHWREKFFCNAVAGGADPGLPMASSTGDIEGNPAAVSARGYSPLPFWLELSLYASMPLFHFHTFLALSIVLFLLFVFECSLFAIEFVRKRGVTGARTAGDAQAKLPISKHLLILVGCALIPATFFVWLITDHFHAGSVVGWAPGWVQALKGDAMARPFVSFWFVNFGLWLPLVLTYVGLLCWRVWKTGIPKEMPEDLAFVGSAVAIFLITFFFKLAPWGWDNTKLLIWAYFIVLPFLWRDLIAEWSVPVRAAICIALFGSGFVSVTGGLAAGRPGFGFANRQELDAVGDAVRSLPVQARFAAFPTYNHPLLLQGRKLVMGYPGHLWTQGFDDYAATQNELREVMQGGRNWRETAHRLGVRYIFWGREEELNYPMSARPWQRTALRVKSGKDWGTIYDLEPISVIGD